MANFMISFLRTWVVVLVLGLGGGGIQTAFCKVETWPVSVLIPVPEREVFFRDIQKRIFNGERDPVLVRQTVQDAMGDYGFLYNYHGWIHEEFISWISKQSNLKEGNIVIPACGLGSVAFDAFVVTSSHTAPPQILASDIMERYVHGNRGVLGQLSYQAKERLEFRKKAVTEDLESMRDESIAAYYSAHLIPYLSPEELNKNFALIKKKLQFQGRLFLSWSGYEENLVYTVEPSMLGLFGLIESKMAEGVPYPKFVSSEEMSELKFQDTYPRYYPGPAEIEALAEAHGLKVIGFKRILMQSLRIEKELGLRSIISWKDETANTHMRAIPVLNMIIEKSLP